MATSTFLRSCICSMLILCFIVDASAQRAGRRRSVSTSVNPVVSSVDTSIIPGQTNVPVLRCEKRVIPGELFSRADLIRSQKELANLQYFNQEIEIETVAIDNVIIEGDESVDEEIVKTPDCRETNPVNRSNIADAYPFLSEDGLRLYFTSNREGGHGRFFISTRKTVHDAFGEPKVLSKHLTDGYYAGSLTADELTLCMVKSGDMYISIRANRNETFPVPVKVSGTNDIYHFGPSISPDGKEIVVTISIGEKDRTRVYQRTGTYQVSNPKDLAIPAVGEPGPGQLSKDGLHYYLSIETKNSEHLWRYSRAALGDDFSNLEELPEQMKGLKNILQPSFNKDGSVMVFVTAPYDSWSNDDILLVNNGLKEEEEPVFVKPEKIFVLGPEVKKHLEIKPYSVKLRMPSFNPVIGGCSTPGVPVQQVVDSKNTPESRKTEINTLLSGIKVYPNPFISSINIEIEQLPKTGAILTLYDITGKMIRQEQVSNNITTVSLDRLIPGTYSFQLTNKKGELLSSGNLVKAE